MSDPVLRSFVNLGAITVYMMLVGAVGYWLGKREKRNK